MVTSFVSARPRGLLIGSLLAASLVLTACGEKSPEQLVSLAKTHLEKREFNAATIHLKNALTKQPENAEARFMLGEALLNASDARGAEAEFRRALQYKLPEDRVIPSLARALVESGQGKKAIDEFNSKVLASPPQEAELRTQIGLANLQLNQPAAAEKAFDAALKAQPGHVPARIAQARMLMLRGKPADAEKAADALIAEIPGNIDALFLKAELLIGTRNFEGATQLLDKVVTSSPRAGGAWFMLVMALAEQQKPDEAKKRLADFKKAVPRDIRATYLEAWMALRDRNVPGARDAALAVLKVVPDHVPSLVIMGLVEHETANFSQAEDYLKRALERVPGHSIAVNALVSTYLRSGQPARALERLEPYLRGGNVTDPQLLALAGEAYLSNNRVDEARRYFEAAGKMGQKDARVQLRLGQIYLSTNDDERALKALGTAASLDPASDQADLIVITNSLQRRDATKALVAIDALEQKRPKSALPHNLRGSALLIKADTAGARAAFAKALAMDAAYFPAAANLASLDLREGKRGDAIKRFEQMLAKEPKNSRIAIALADVLTRDGRPPKEVSDVLDRSIKESRTVPELHLALVGHHLRNNNAKLAASAAQAGVAALPDNVQLLEQLGLAQQAAGEGNQAIATFNKLATLQPGTAAPWIRAGRAYVSMKDYAGAVRAFRKALDTDANSLDAARDLASAYVLQGSPDSAIKEARVVQTKQAKSGLGFAMEGDVYAALSKWTEADQAYARGLAVQPLPGLVVRRLVVLESAGQKSAADAVVQNWLAREPKDVVVRSFLAERAMQQKNFAVAATHYRAATSAQPENYLLWNNLAWVAGKVGDAKAIEYADRALKLAPESAPILDPYGTLLIERGETDRGLEYLQRAAQLAPQLGEVRINLARGLIKAGKKKEARAEVETALKLPNAARFRDDADALLKTL